MADPKATQRSDGILIDYTPEADMAAGDVAFIGAIAGVARRPIAAGELGALCTEGVFDLEKASGEAIEAGEVVYWDADGNDTGAATATSTDNTRIGVAVTDAATTDATVRVKINA